LLSIIRDLIKQITYLFVSFLEWQGRTPIALKKIKDPAQSDSIKAESKILYTLAHPNIVIFYGLFKQENDLFMALEWVQGGDLKNLLEEEGARLLNAEEPTISIANMLEMLQDVAAGMAYIGGINPPIVHRDLALRNLLYSQNMATGKLQIKVSDFGLARQTEVIYQV